VLNAPAQKVHHRQSRSHRLIVRAAGQVPETAEGAADPVVSRPVVVRSGLAVARYADDHESRVHRLQPVRTEVPAFQRSRHEIFDQNIADSDQFQQQGLAFRLA